MPSPFPGMDPYLEGEEWSSVHTALSVEIARQLAPKLRPRYVARTELRFAAQGSDVYPDVGVAVREAQVTYRAGPPLEMTTFVPESAPEYTVEIRTVAGRQLVTSIEVLSPANKRGEGYRVYMDKRERLLRSPTHLIEIDLLRAGKRLPTIEPLPDAPYFIFLSRAERRPKIQVWPVALRDVLPIVPVPLLPGDADSQLDLQAALAGIYDALGYDLSINYRQPPPDPPLSKADAAWATGLLRQAGY
ncbi:MAG: hypothetical protein KatS3mg053_2205 [Candidatus Roseilinea sp.]|nr:MAG: hypothetical protein KatS3mg053_2205 [Candidatus Roseilinea sp.]